MQNQPRTRNVVMLSLFLGLAVLGAACESPSGSPSSTDQPSSPASAALQECPIVSAAEVSAAAGARATLAVGESLPERCVFDLADDTSARIVVRVEDSFVDLRSVLTTFPDATSEQLGQANAVWAPGVMTLWVAANDGLIAVQILGVADDVAPMHATATSIARLIVSP